MKLSTTAYPDRLVIVVEGRLDATWSDHFLQSTRLAVREGHHHLRLDAVGLEYLSSAGLRSLLQTQREVSAVRGSFQIFRASDFVIQTLRMSGFDALLMLDEPTQEPSKDSTTAVSGEKIGQTWSHEGMDVQVYELGRPAAMVGEHLGRWQPWSPIDLGACQEIAMGGDQVSLGLGTPGRGEELREHLGDFLSLAGCTAYQAGDGSEAPDFLLGVGQYVPKMNIADALRATGDFSSLIRFQPKSPGAVLPLDLLIDGAFKTTGSSHVVLTVIAEIEGLVGLSWLRSPGRLELESKASEFPQVQEWLSFSGERVHGGDLAVIVAFASIGPLPPGLTLPQMPSRPGWHLHAHAVVFPFRPLPNGQISQKETVAQIFSGSAPQALLHLVEDKRPTFGIGLSSFIRGACWCAPLEYKTEAKS